MLAVPPDCDNAHVKVELVPRVRPSVLSAPELNVMFPLTPSPPIIPPKTFNVPPFILTVPPLFNNPALAVTVCPLVLKVPAEPKHAQKLSLMLTGPLAEIVPLVCIKVKIENAEPDVFPVLTDLPPVVI